MSETSKPTVDAVRMIEVALLARRYAGLQLALLKAEARRRFRRIVLAAAFAGFAALGVVICVGFGAAAAVMALHEAGHSLPAAFAMVAAGALCAALALLVSARHLLRRIFRL